jgi:hypothetical protein
MVEKIAETAGRDWAKSAVNSISTVLLGLLVAWVTGFLELKQVVAMQTMQLKVIEVKLDERAKEFIQLQLNGSVVDQTLKGNIELIRSQHELMLREIELTKNRLRK